MMYEGREVVVTGGTGALGGALVSALLDAGAVCHVPYRTAEEAERFPRRGHERVILSPCADLTDEDEVQALYARAPRLWASIHLAGGFAFAPIGQSDVKLLKDQIGKNLISCYLCCRAAIGAMVPQEKGGRIVNVAARPALEWRGGAGMSAYTASKAGVAALTAALAEEVAKTGILVNAVAPSILDTPANRREMPNADHALWPKLDEVAATILFLASPGNRVTRGAVVPVYGRS